MGGYNPKTPMVKGVALNPRGRPKGAKNKSKQIIEKLESAVSTPEMVKEIKKVFKKTVAQALDGDTTCQKILWDRFLPIKRFENQGPTKSPQININIGEVTTSSSHESPDAPIVHIEEAEVISETKH